MAPYDNTTDVEIGLSRHLTFSDDAQGMPGLLNPDNSPIFPAEDFLLLFEAEDADYNSVEFMPNADPVGGTGIIYAFAATTPLTGVHGWEVY